MNIFKNPVRYLLVLVTNTRRESKFYDNLYQFSNIRSYATIVPILILILHGNYNNFASIETV